MHGGLELTVFLRAEEAGDDDGAADIAAEGERDEDQRDLVAVAHGRERALADQLPRDQTVRDIRELLEYDACESLQAEPPKHALRPADG